MGIMKKQTGHGQQENGNWKTVNGNSTRNKIFKTKQSLVVLCSKLDTV